MAAANNQGAILSGGAVFLQLHQIGPAFRLETRAADQHSIDLVLRHQSLDIALVHAAAVEHRRPTAKAELRHHAANRSMDLGSVLWCGVLPGTDSPDRFVGDQNAGEIGGRKIVQSFSQLPGHDRLGLLSLSFRELFPTHNIGVRPASSSARTLRRSLRRFLQRRAAARSVPRALRSHRHP